MASMKAGVNLLLRALRCTLIVGSNEFNLATACAYVFRDSCMNELKSVFAKYFVDRLIVLVLRVYYGILQRNITYFL